MLHVTDVSRAYLTVVELATLCRVSKMTIYRLVQTGELPHVKVGRSIRIPATAAAHLLNPSDDARNPPVPG